MSDAFAEGSIALRPFTPADLTARYVEWLNDPEVTRFSELRHRVHTEEECREYVAGMQAGGNWLLAIHFVGESQARHVGNVAVYFDVPNQTAELSILIGEREYWGRGLGLMAWREAARKIFAETDVCKIAAGTMATNAAMLRTMTAAGMTPDGVQKAQLNWNGERVDVVRFAFFRDASGE
jgi:RimJ/RimL family protein N-acetyltransferase